MHGNAIGEVLVIELYQAEWCPSCRRVRQRLAERGIDFVARQVAAWPEDRSGLEGRIGSTSVPALIPPDGEPRIGEQAIGAWLDELGAEPEGAAAHRERAARARRKECEEFGRS